MKKVDPKALEQMAKEKNIDKDKIEKIASNYKGKSESELMDELIKIGKTLEGKEEVVSKFKTFLDENQRKKLDSIMNKISEAELQDKIESKKSKSKKTNVSKHAPTKSTFLDENQRKKLDSIMNKISEAELQDKIESKKSKSKKTNVSKHAPTKSSPKESSNKGEAKNKTTKKVKKVVKKTKKSPSK